MLSRLLILSLLIPASVAPAAAQSSPDKIAPPRRNFTSAFPRYLKTRRSIHSCRLLHR